VKIAINRDSTVPIRDQLIEQIGLQIASGSLRAEEKLPSVRALAGRLGIHYNTVSSAYNHLAEVGLLEVRQGSGVRVAGKPRRRELEMRGVSLEELVKGFLAMVAEQGYSRSEVAACLEKAMNQPPVKRILVADRNPDFHPLLIAELQPHFKLPVEPVTVEGLATNPGLLTGSLVVTSLYHVFSLRDLELDPTHLVVCNVEPGRTEMEAVARLPAGSLVVLVSVSPTLLKMATNVMAAVRGSDLAFRTILLEERAELEYTMQYADLVICDEPSKEATMRLARRAPVQVFQLYSDSTVELIRQRLARWG
jgi:DNA-binding transcriptional regulator YhcF (GntR family)